MRQLIAGLVLLGVFGAGCVADAANKLFNGNLELSPDFAYYDGVADATPATDPNLVPGWTMFGHTPPDPSSWVQVSYNFIDNHILDLSGSEFDGTDADFIGLAGIQTAVGSRPAVAPGLTYKASVTYDRYFAPAGVSYFIDWFDDLGNLISSNGGALSDPSGPLVFVPTTQKFEIVASAPGAAASAGVRLLSETDSFSGASADNFSFVPEPGTVALAVMALCGLVAAGRRRG